jgi:4-hydroxy-tetrahydrodipicolinate reductase
VARVLKVALVGLGPIGQAIGRVALDTDGLQVVGATDLAPDQGGRDLGALLGLGRKVRVKVDADPERFMRRTRADVAVLCTSSSLKTLRPQVLALVKSGMNVVTTCEELAYPTPPTAALFREIDAAAARKKVSVLATGVNPGYAMDALALMLTAPCSHVRRVSVSRCVDAATRRLPLQRKVGAGLNLNQFRRAMTEGTVRHVGLRESVYMIADGLGWKLDRVEETLEAAIAPRDLDTEYLRIPAGGVAGIKQHARGFRGEDALVSLDLQMYVGAESPRDHVYIDGTPPIDMTIKGGIAGDPATAAIVVNSIPKLMAARPGVVTMKDLPLVHRFNALELKNIPARKK